MDNPFLVSNCGSRLDPGSAAKQLEVELRSGHYLIYSGSLVQCHCVVGTMDDTVYVEPVID